ncbi:MAG: hypothetical protein ABI147_06805 [Acidobacteriaceae bacterium]
MTFCKFSIAALAGAWLCSCIVPISVAQDPAKPKHLKNEQLLEAAQTANGLGVTSGALPWHVRAQYETFDKQGKHTDAGTFEEWWFGSKSYKTVYTSDTFKQTDVATANGLYRSADQAWATAQQDLVPLLLSDPLSVHQYNPKRNELIDETRTAPGVKLRCVILLRKPAADERAGSNLNADPNLYPSYCFDADSTLLRYETGGSGNGVTVFNGTVKFRDRFISRDIQVLNGGKKSLSIHIAELGPIPSAAATPTAPESNATLIAGRIALPEDRLHVVDGLAAASQSLRLLANSGVLPDFAVELVVGKDGRVLESSAPTAPPGIATTLAKAARKLVFEPFTVLGEPVEVSTTVHHRSKPSDTDAATIF